MQQCTVSNYYHSGAHILTRFLVPCAVLNIPQPLPAVEFQKIVHSKLCNYISKCSLSNKCSMPYARLEDSWEGCCHSLRIRASTGSCRSKILAVLCMYQRYLPLCLVLKILPYKDRTSSFSPFWLHHNQVSQTQVQNCLKIATFGLKKLCSFRFTCLPVPDLGSLYLKTAKPKQ